MKERQKKESEFLESEKNKSVNLTFEKDGKKQKKEDSNKRQKRKVSRREIIQRIEMQIAGLKGSLL